MQPQRPSSESSDLNLSLYSNKRGHSRQFERVNSALPRPLRFGSLVPSLVAAGRRLCDVRRHFKAATQSLHTRRGPVRLGIASGRRPREQGRRSLRAYNEGRSTDWNGMFPYVVREGTRQRKDVRYVGKYRSGTGRVAPNLAIKGWGPVPRK
ncbi:unnamed protein product [Sphagnum tenellum]